MSDSQVCRDCDIEKPLSEFYPSKSNRSGLTYQCKLCSNARSKRYRKNNPTPVDVILRKAARTKAQREALSLADRQAEKRRYRYGVTQDRFTEMLAEQDGRCPICLRDLVDTLKVTIDHDHTCCPGGKSCGRCVRGILCHSCNMIVGYALDDTDRLDRSIKYLRDWTSRGRGA